MHGEGQRREAEANFGGGFTIGPARCATGRDGWGGHGNIGADDSGALGRTGTNRDVARFACKIVDRACLREYELHPVSAPLGKDAARAFHGAGKVASVARGRLSFTGARHYGRRQAI